MNDVAWGAILARRERERRQALREKIERARIALRTVNFADTPEWATQMFAVTGTLDGTKRHETRLKIGKALLMVDAKALETWNTLWLKETESSGADATSKVVGTAGQVGSSSLAETEP
ncbi:MAG: hypothetical protein ABIH46_08320 [Chloroflexota bacterium]